ncbi:TPA: hypothetical protein ACPJ16_002383 [Vibrio alginolyticus]
MNKEPHLAYEEALSELEKTGIDYSNDIFSNNNEEITAAFQKAIKDTYGIDAVIHNGFVFLTAVDAAKNSEFGNVYGCLDEELIDISNVITRRLDEQEEDNTDFIQREFDISRLTSRILNAIDEQYDLDYDPEFDVFFIMHKEAGCDHDVSDIVKCLEHEMPEAFERLDRDYIVSEIESFVNEKMELAETVLKGKRELVIEQCRELGITKEIFEQMIDDKATDSSDGMQIFRDAGASEEEIAQMVANNK